ncbi:hypothetical protein B6D60_08250 [candidate division KSB1 bacterium 4484_87]|nr:MAG: hypothetical protein B6D60_08250 [candidate division KSB1 bacterium 4484_87]
MYLSFHIFLLQIPKKNRDFVLHCYNLINLCPYRASVANNKKASPPTTTVIGKKLFLKIKFHLFFSNFLHS